MNKIKLYTPRQISSGAFFGGPIAAVYALHKNYVSRGNAKASKQTLIWGSLSVVGVLLLSMMVPKEWPSLVFIGEAIAIWLVADRIAEATQLAKDAIVNSAEYESYSNWNVLGMIVLSVIAQIVVNVPLVIIVKFVKAVVFHS